MPYSTNVADYPLELVREVAIECIERDRPYAEAVRKLQPRFGDLNVAKVQAICKAVKRAGWAPTALLIPGDRQDSRALEAELRDRFGLLACTVTPGRAEMLSRPLDGNVREVIMEQITRAAAVELDRWLGEIDEPCVAVNFGVVSRRIQGHLHPDRGIKHRPGERQRGLVVAAQGVRSLRADRFDANNIVRDIARMYGYDHRCVPVPAYVADLGESLKRLPLMQEMEAAFERVNLVVGSLGSLHQEAPKPDGAEAEHRPAEESAFKGSLQHDLSREEHRAAIGREGGIANVGGWWYNALGSPCPHSERTIAGLSLTRIKQLVARKQPVLLAVGGDPTRVPALWVALKHGICSVLCVDEVTAGLLVGRYQFQHRVVDWERPSEIDILTAAGMIG